jgi:hypothetical protein
MYNAPTVSAQGNREGMYMVNVGYRQDLLKRKLSLTIQVMDPFKSSKMKSTIETPTMLTRTTFIRESQVVTLSLSYKINNYNTKEKRRSGEMNQMDFGGEDGF